MMRGSCLCGGVAFEADPPFREVVACHCTQCRKTSGHYWAAASVPHDRFRLTEERGLAWFRSSPSALRGFCRDCGASVLWQPEGEARISFAAGCIDGPSGLTLEAHWFGEDAGDYYSPEGPPPPPSPAETLQGSCLCGANRFSLTGPMGAVTACHCSQCRKTSGHYAASFDADEASLIWQARKTASFTTPGGGRRSFCPDCGSSLGFRAADGAFSVEAGCIDNPTGGTLTRHIFTADRADYVTLDDGLPQDPQG